MLADQAALDRSSEEEHRSGGAVIGSARCVLLDAASELAEGHHQHALIVLLLLQIGPERADAFGELFHELVVTLPLASVGVEATEAHVINARGHAASDHRGDRF